ncbi:MAG: hypothetical protein OXG55_14620 [bacterium]|nr:hypothetical protein [bacterium]MCY4104472.1 hypothetical protein [bacterium]
MSRFRWTNPSLPQTLQIAVLLLYITAFFGILRGLISIGHPLGVFLFLTGLIAFAGAAGLVRERRHGYWLAGLYALMDVVGEVLGMLDEFSGWDLIGLLLAIALAGLLLHPMSRQHYRTWFR